MFLIDAPYVSDYLKQSLQELQTPVVRTIYAEEALLGYDINFISEEDAALACAQEPGLEFFTNSENALEWIFNNQPGSALVEKVISVKDKIRFRDVLKAIHPEYFYQGCQFVDLQTIDPEDLPYPVILKPSVGFFSLGVQRIDSREQWLATLANLESQSKSYEGIYPSGVLDSSAFIIEAVIPGHEFAVDCYFDTQGEVVILNMMKHLFASGADVNDRVYFTSSAIMEVYLEPVQAYLNSLGKLFKLKNFQAHIEIRIAEDEIAAIEINPLRFGGWCSTADLAQYAWDMNLYEVLTRKMKPDWDELIQRDPDNVYALIVLNNSSGVPGSEITNFDYQALLETVGEPLELRKTDYSRFPLFGFLMCRVPARAMGELNTLLHSDLRAFISSDHSG